MSLPVLLIAVSLLAIWAGTALWHYWLELRKRRVLGERMFGYPGHPLWGNLAMFPKCRYEWTQFLISESNKALAQGHSIIRWWAGWKLAIWTMDAETSRLILEHSTELKKGRDYEFYEQWLGKGLLLSDGPRWRRQRKALTPTFHFSMLDQYESVFNRQAEILVEKLASLEGQGQQDIAPLITRCSLDIIGEAAMGIQLGSQRDGSTAYVRAVAEFNHLAHIFHVNILYWFQPFWYLFGHGWQTRRHLRTLKGFTEKVIQEREHGSKQQQQNLNAEQFTDSADVNATVEKKKMGKKGRAFMDILLEMCGRGQMSREEIREQTDTFMFAGHDTTATALSWTLWCLACHPQCQRRARSEILQQLGEDRTKMIGAVECNELRYLDRCVREALRLFPPVPVLERDLQDDLWIDGVMVPAGTMVIVSPLILHHNEKVYPDHWNFDPDNFLPEVAAARSSFDFVPFSAGPRNCIGQKFAQLELKVLLVHLLRRFHFRAAVPFLANRPALEAILRPELGIPVHIESASAAPLDDEHTEETTVAVTEAPTTKTL